MTVPFIPLDPSNERAIIQKKCPPLIDQMKSLEISSRRNSESSISNMLKKIKHHPPKIEIAKSFFNMCIARACLSINEYNKYEEKVLHKIPAREALACYISDNFTHEGNIQYKMLSEIGHLLMCGGIPNTHSVHVRNYRVLLGGKSVYDRELMFSRMPMWLVKIVKYHNKFNPEHARIGGCIMCQFMVYCTEGRPLPDIDFVNSRTVSLTEEQKNRLMASKN
ncbi:uncharacterized protein EV154DRAFT_509947 [Mucor mucedo]|uniref:uncharacterized protein n=1 Tax=Mucor mucedo TaxID=29922 RepID=UPI00221ED904|nr:uncharacterized protein EV154DRAFT_509947 [Mucor mucedo]KAI7890904.1 hypothetical protein EV154DRAFT_509947 [Mucor mucedo]